MSLRRAKTSAGILVFLLTANLAWFMGDELSGAIVGLLAIPLYVVLAAATLAFVWMDSPSHEEHRSERVGQNRIRQALVALGCVVLAGMLILFFFPPNVALAP